MIHLLIHLTCVYHPPVAHPYIKGIQLFGIVLIQIPMHIPPYISYIDLACEGAEEDPNQMLEAYNTC
jgi:hypothetical protein